MDKNLGKLLFSAAMLTGTLAVGVPVMAGQTETNGVVSSAYDSFREGVYTTGEAA